MEVTRLNQHLGRSADIPTSFSIEYVSDFFPCKANSVTGHSEQRKSFLPNLINQFQTAFYVHMHPHMDIWATDVSNLS